MRPRPPVANEGYAPVPGGKVWWRKVGDGPKTPLLVLHGGPGAAHNYMNALFALNDQRPVILYDQLGCGRSDIPNDNSLWTIGRFCDEIDALRAALGLTNVILLGHSWGGWLAIEYMTRAATAPKVEALVLSSTSASTREAIAGMRGLLAGLPNGAGQKILALEAAGKTDTPEYRALSDLWNATYLFTARDMPPDGQASFEALAKSPVYPFMNGPSEWNIVGTLKDWDRTKDLGRIAVPTLVTVGEKDEVPLACSQTLVAGIKGARLEVLKGAPHLYPLQFPDLYNGLVRNFLTDKP